MRSSSEQNVSSSSVAILSLAWILIVPKYLYISIGTGVISEQPLLVWRLPALFQRTYALSVVVGTWMISVAPNYVAIFSCGRVADR